MTRNADEMNGDAASLAISALSWIAADGELMGRFLTLTGIEPANIRAVADEPGFLSGVLEFLLAHEPTLMRFCEENAIKPETVGRAQMRLGGGAMPGPGDFTG